MPETQSGVELLFDHARQAKQYEPRHCACFGCQRRIGHVPAVAK